MRHCPDSDNFREKHRAFFQYFLDGIYTLVPPILLNLDLSLPDRGTPLFFLIYLLLSLLFSAESNWGERYQKGLHAAKFDYRMFEHEISPRLE